MLLYPYATIIYSFASLIYKALLRPSDIIRAPYRQGYSFCWFYTVAINFLFSSWRNCVTTLIKQCGCTCNKIERYRCSSLVQHNKKSSSKIFWKRCKASHLWDPQVHLKLFSVNKLEFLFNIRVASTLKLCLTRKDNS